MSLADLNFKLSYNNKNADVVKEFLIPALKEAKQYDRAVGFFSSSSLISISYGIKGLIENGGKIRVICSPHLSDEDKAAIKEGYETRTIIEKALINSIEPPKTKFEEERYNILSHLIANNILDIKIAFIASDSSEAMFHDKVGVITDENSNFVAFNGSLNDSLTAYYKNSETIDVYTSISSDYNRALEKKNYFESLWNNQGVAVDVREFSDDIFNNIHKYKKDEIDYTVDQREIETINAKKEKKKPSVPSYISIRDYQKEAFSNWEENDYRGIYDMATGTGKTYTALYSIVNLLKAKKNKLGIIICCPYQHLVDQWTEDLDAFGFSYIIGFSGSKHKNWKKRLKKAIFDYSHNISDYFCFITTNASFASKYVQDCLSDSKKDLLLVVDEAHNFGTARLVATLDDRFKHRLALSATLERHNDLVGTEKLYDFFEKKCIVYSLKQAIEEGKLCNYYYYPIVVYLQENELENYNELSDELKKYITVDRDGIIKYSKKAEMILIRRARVVAGAVQKYDALKRIAEKYKDDNHLLVYCGSTTVVDDDYVEGKASDEELRQIDKAISILNDYKIVASRFTSQENSKQREILRKEFDDGSVIQALVAIRCLDEGVNIPSIDKAVIMASSTNPKEYIQRRGRVLRTYPNKQYSIIYDMVTLPRDLDCIRPTTDIEYDLSLIRREIKRVKDFAELSLNEYASDELIAKIESVYGYIGEDNYD